MSYHYKSCIRGDYESSCAHDWRAKKKKIAHKFKLEDPKFDSCYDPSVLEIG